MAAWLGYLMGVAIDPLTWGIVLVVAFGGRRLQWYNRVAIATAAVLVVSLVIASTLRAGEASNPNIVAVTTLAAFIWSLVVEGIIAFRKSDSKPKVYSPPAEDTGAPAVESPRAMPDVLHFKGSKEAFDHACKYMQGEVREKQALAALVVDGSALSDLVQALISQFDAKRAENVFDTYRVRVSGDSGGFDAVALCYRKGAALAPGDLVYWVPIQTDPMLAMMAKDKRESWIGGIVAKLEPSLSLKDGWLIKERYQ